VVKKYENKKNLTGRTWQPMDPFPLPFARLKPVSAGNCAHIYDMSLSKQPPFNENELHQWKFGHKLETEHVWDAFVIYSLLANRDRISQRTRQSVALVVPHTGNQKDRFTAAMSERNERVICEGQDELPHYCKKCM
jgi:hypothetical protein